MVTTEVKRNLFLASFLIITIYVLCFGFLSYHEFKEWKFYPFFESMIGVFMSAGAIAIITGIILVFQAAIQSTQEKNKEVFIFLPLSMHYHQTYSTISILNFFIKQS